MSKRLFGKTSGGEEVYAYTLANSKGMEVEILDLGCIIRSIRVPDGKGVTRDVVLGYDELADRIPFLRKSLLIFLWRSDRTQRKPHMRCPFFS